jgi:oligopeptide/dipeptide ABC transporter ATP-binding protein
LLPRLDREEERLTPISGSPPSLLNLPPGCPFAPRCPMRREACDSSEPPLRGAGHDAHLSACHFADELVDTGAEDVFDAVGADTEALARFAGTPPSTRSEEDSA